MWKRYKIQQTKQLMAVDNGYILAYKMEYDVLHQPIENNNVVRCHD